MFKNENLIIAQWQGKFPLTVKNDKFCEELAFPYLLPTGKFCYNSASN